MFTIDEIKELIKAVDQSSIGHLEWNNQGAKLVITKNPGMTKMQPATVPASSGTVLRESVETVAVAGETAFCEVLSPSVGTFYAAAEPGAAPFVTIGDSVESDTVVCTLEAMKLFNEVAAGVTGEVVKILVKDGDFVEYGQPLFVVKP
jgi:acetyl-CoA carboxylase biotin carboxyl carrier protein